MIFSLFDGLELHSETVLELCFFTQRAMSRSRPSPEPTADAIVPK
ncbi:MAG: hypothetical protein RIG63_22435 [Coleofasciculus chthonoplastes F3-SA18-01]